MVQWQRGYFRLFYYSNVVNLYEQAILRQNQLKLIITSTFGNVCFSHQSMVVWGSWISQHATHTNGKHCQGMLVYSSRTCDSPSPEYCGKTCGEKLFKIDILPGNFILFTFTILYFFWFICLVCSSYLTLTKTIYKNLKLIKLISDQTNSRRFRRRPPQIIVESAEPEPRRRSYYTMTRFPEKRE